VANEQCSEFGCNQERQNGRTICRSCRHVRYLRKKGVAASSTSTGETPSVTTNAAEGSAVSRVYSDSELETLSGALLEDDLLRFWSLDPDEWVIVDGSLVVNRWSVTNGKGERYWNHQFKARLLRRVNEGGEIAEVLRAPAVTVDWRPTASSFGDFDRELTIVHLDAQIGYWQDHDGNWHTTHDESALDLDLQITQAAAEWYGVARQVDVGDLLDLPMLSTFKSAPAVVAAPALNRATARTAQWLSAAAALTPEAELHWIMGNHEQRLIKWLSHNAPHLIGLKRAGENEPLLSIDSLTGANEYGWQIEGPYPDGAVWLNHNTKVEHGTVAKGTAGATADTYLKEEVNRIYGHATRTGIVFRDVPRNDQLRTYVAAGGGGRMKIDGAVPDGGGVNEWGEPGRGAAKPWHQGVMLVWTDPDGHDTPEVEFVSFYSGRAFWQGQKFMARVNENGE